MESQSSDSIFCFLIGLMSLMGLMGPMSIISPLKTKTPCEKQSVLRKLGDSNPRYGNPYVSLANWWFQPLTQTSFRLAGAKIDLL